MTVNEQILKGKWDTVKGKVRERWGQLSDQELEESRGNVEQLVGLIRERTGETRADVEAYLESVAEQGRNYAQKATQAVAEQASGIAALAEETAGHVTDSARQSYAQTRKLVRRHPAESLAVCFGVGLVTGVLVGLMVRSR